MKDERGALLGRQGFRPGDARGDGGDSVLPGKTYEARGGRNAVGVFG